MLDNPFAVDGSRLRPLDRDLLGLEPHPDDATVLSLVVEPHLCRTDGRFYGGAALAAALAASEAVTGRPALWSTTQLVAIADLGERISLGVDVVASGRTVDQVHVRGTVDDRLIFSAVGATATPRSGGLQGVGQTMPVVPPPDDCEDWLGLQRARIQAGAETIAERSAVGHHLISEYRVAPMTGSSAGRPGHEALWTRLTGDLASTTAPISPAALGFLADMIPIAVCHACGVEGAGTSLDNSLRIGVPVETDWVLLELDAHIAVGGFGHGQVHLWSPDGRMLATGTQSARLFALSDFVNRRAR
jgi:acyl-CoA thioesterase